MLNRRQRAFTLIEMMVGLAILAFLLMMGVPAFSTFMQNQKLRASADALLSGLQLARAEAVRRNGRVEMVLTDDDAIAATVNSITPSTTGRNWVVRYYNPSTLFYEFVQGRTGSVGSGSLDSTTVSVAAADATIAFTGLGATTLGASSTYQVTNPSGGACVPTGPMRCLNVVVSPGGQVKMCDPDTRLAARDTRKC